jgi:hypothetical protein
MSTILNILLFIIILFLYIHITHQLKTSEDLEIYEMDYSSNTHLQEVCEIKQPVLFEYKSINPEFFENLNIDSLGNIGTNDLKVKEIADYWKSDEAVDFVVIPLQSAETLISSDTHSNYFTENNDEFVEETGLSKEYAGNDTFLKPIACLQTKYDIMMGSKSISMPLRYHTCYRQYICVNSGKIHIKMTPWKSKKYLYPIYDYENYEFRSPINVWNPQKKYMHEMDKIKFLEFDVLEGSVLYIPPYWWYSIKYSEEPTLLSGFTYNSVMNCLANIPNWGLYFLQQHNIKKKVTKTIDFDVKPEELEKELEETKQEDPTE